MKRFIEGEDRTQVTLLPACLEDYVEAENPVRVVEVFVDGLDLGGLGFVGVDPAVTGRPAYHPAVLLKLYIYGYLNRIQSSRRLEREAQRNVELMWLTGRLRPDFKTIANFRKDNETGQARVTVHCLLALWVSFIALFGFAHDAHAGTDGLQHDVVFTDYSPLSSNSELLRRLVSPLAAAQARQILARSGKVLSEQPINPSEEKFVVYVPPQEPPHGYALLVFVPPWQDARLPQGWASVLDHYGVIFVSAARSGNDESVLGRREPLALIAAQNIIRRYAVDPERVYIAGFSGGSRVAMRLALGYPDVFRGALLNAGSDPIGDAGAPTPPPKELFLQFQNSTRLIYVTGENDLFHLSMAADSMHSMQEWCVFDVYAEVTPRAGHEVADSRALSRALHALLNPVPPDPNKLAACRSVIEGELIAKLQQVESLIASGKQGDAQKLLIEIDRHFGGLAAPRSIELGSVPN